MNNFNFKGTQNGQPTVYKPWESTRNKKSYKQTNKIPSAKGCLAENEGKNFFFA